MTVAGSVMAAQDSLVWRVRPGSPMRALIVGDLAVIGSEKDFFGVGGLLVGLFVTSRLAARTAADFCAGTAGFVDVWVSIGESAF